MRTLSLIVGILSLGSIVACEGGVEKKQAAATGVTSNEAGLAGSLAIQLEPKSGEPATSIANAVLTVADHPEITSTADANGKITMNHLLPGTLTMYVLSADGTSLAAGASTYGLKLDDVVIKGGQTNDLGTKEFKKTGAIKGVVAFFQNPNNLDLTGSDVFIPGTGFIAKTDAQGRFTLAGLPEGTYKLRLQHTGFAVLDLEGVEVKEGEPTDLGTAMLSLSNGPEGSISATADLVAVIGGTSRKVVKSRDASFQLNYDSDAALMKISDEPTFLNKSWQPVAETVTWTFASDGPKSLYVMFSDLNGLESSPFADEVLVDTEAPVLTSVTLLNGWTQSAQLQVIADLVASDTGSGIAEIMFSNADGTFTNGETWQSYAERKNWDLSAGDGAKIVYAKVRDYAGNVSDVKSDAINKGAYSIILNTAYSKKLTLYKAQSPYKIANSIQIDSDLEIEPGVTIEMDQAKSLNVKGVLTAIGTAAFPITFTKNASATCANDVHLDEGLPGVSEQHRLSYVTFDAVFNLHLNGGEISHTEFDGTACAGARPFNIKTGEDNLYMHDNVFTNYLVGIQVKDGTGNTRFENNSGSLIKAITQEDGATGTIFRNNNFTWNGDPGLGSFIEIYSGSLTMTDNTFGGSTASIIKRQSETEVTLRDLTVTSCNTVLSHNMDQTNNTRLTIEDSTFANCEVINGFSQAPITFQHNTIGLTDHLTEAGAYVGTHVFYRNNITCASVSGYCDLAHHYGMATQVVQLTENNITCVAANGCRGGFVTLSPSGSTSGNYTVQYSGNHFTSKTPVANLSLSIVLANYVNRNTTTNADITGYELKFSNDSVQAGTWNATGEGSHVGSPVAGAGPR